MIAHLLALVLGLQVGIAAAEPPLAQPTALLPVVVVTGDDTVIRESCIVRIAPDAVIADSNGDGVIHIEADGITVAFEEGSVLRGAAAGIPADRFAGTGVRIEGRRNVVLRDARVSGFKVGVRAERAPGLVVDGGDLSGNFRQRLRSTPRAEDNTDWLWPHDNDNGEWLTRYGAALAVKQSEGVTIRNITVRRGQNGIVLDRVNDSKIYDNDCSFLSGWGLAMWRSSRNMISRNAFDFCIRGYSHGFYNRGQDSAGILMFEQCEENLILENSATHGGDGLFGYAGKEAVGERPHSDPEFYAKPRGNNRNLIAGNDFSYAAAHGLEMTFSHGNRIEGNRFAGNAICGIWGGYSQDTTIAENTFELNGDAGYGLERGGVNIEHGSGNRIVRNTFRHNAAGVHLWWDDDGALLEKPGIKAHYRGVSDNVIAGNTFEGDKVALHLRDLSAGEGRVVGTIYQDNSLVEVEKELDKPERIELHTRRKLDVPILDEIPAAIGEQRPVGARPPLTGRENIIMTEWGPWDHHGPLVHALSTTGRYHMYQFLNMDGEFVRVFVNDLTTDRARMSENKGRWATTIAAPWAGLFPYKIVIDQPGFEQVIAGALLSAKWEVAFFPWEGSINPPQPPADLEAWRALAGGPGAVRIETDSINFAFGMGGPGQLKIDELSKAGFKRDFFGLIARTTVPLQAGEYRVRTLSDDGVRVMVDGQTILENWTHHGPTEDVATFVVESDRTVELVVEYFEIAGYAILEFDIEPTFLDGIRAAGP
jgi:parallel beta-helix repeat protein